MHDQATARALLRAAEDIAAAGGPEHVSVRRVADAAGVSVRAVYSLYGSKDGLLGALGAHAFDLLGQGVRALPVTDDPAADLVEAAVAVFRRFAVEHPSLFQIGVQHDGTSPELVARFDPAAATALTHLRARIARLTETGPLASPLGDPSNATALDTAADTAVDTATMQFHALCEGLAAVELRGALPTGHEEQVWRSGINALVAGFGQPGGTLSPTTQPPGRHGEDASAAPLSFRWHRATAT